MPASGAGPGSPVGGIADGAWSERLAFLGGGRADAGAAYHELRERANRTNKAPIRGDGDCRLCSGWTAKGKLAPSITVAE